MLSTKVFCDRSLIDGSMGVLFSIKDASLSSERVNWSFLIEHCNKLIIIHPNAQVLE